MDGPLTRDVDTKHSDHNRMSFGESKFMIGQSSGSSLIAEVIGLTISHT